MTTAEQVKLLRWLSEDRSRSISDALLAGANALAQRDELLAVVKATGGDRD